MCMQKLCESANNMEKNDVRQISRIASGCAFSCMQYYVILQCDRYASCRCCVGAEYNINIIIMMWLCGSVLTKLKRCEANLTGQEKVQMVKILTKAIFCNYARWWVCIMQMTCVCKVPQYQHTGGVGECQDKVKYGVRQSSCGVRGGRGWKCG